MNREDQLKQVSLYMNTKVGPKEDRLRQVSLYMNTKVGPKEDRLRQVSLNTTVSLLTEIILDIVFDQ
jgi:hypothetical protein